MKIALPATMVSITSCSEAFCLNKYSPALSSPARPREQRQGEQERAVDDALALQRFRDFVDFGPLRDHHRSVAARDPGWRMA